MPWSCGFIYIYIRFYMHLGRAWHKLWDAPVLIWDAPPDVTLWRPSEAEKAEKLAEQKQLLPREVICPGVAMSYPCDIHTCHIRYLWHICELIYIHVICGIHFWTRPYYSQDALPGPLASEQVAADAERDEPPWRKPRGK